MNLEVKSYNAGDLDRFISKYLLKVIRDRCISTINSKKLIRVNEFLNSNAIRIKKSRGDKNKVSAYKLLKLAMAHLIYRKQSDTVYIIEIDSGVIPDGLTAKLVDIVKLINYGNLSVPPYPIITDTFKYVADNLQLYYDNYLLGGG